jgi:hypothetical protein
MEGKKPLGLTGGFESTHLSFPLARRLMRSLHSVVSVTLGGVSHVAEAGSDRGRIASQSVGDDAQWLSSLPAQKSTKEPLCGASITSRLHQNVDYLAVLIDRTPEILQFAVDSKEDLVQMPAVAEPALSSLQLANVVGTELLTPPPDRFIRYEDASFREKILYVSEADAETMVGPDRVTDNLGRKPIAGVARRPIAIHGTSLSVCCKVDNASHTAQRRN